MDNTKLKQIAVVVIAVLLGLLAGFEFYDENKDKSAEEIIQAGINEITNEIVVTEETQALVDETVEATENNEDLSTTETIEATEENVTDEGATETDAVVEQENISYDGDNTGNGQALLGAYQGLTYYSQADSRWANMLYTSTGNTTQTMKSSACGPTSAAIVVSSSKGAILPTTMAQLFVDNGYRTANSGTAWAAYPFIADYFGFKDYCNTYSIDTALSYLNQGYYVIASCGSGLFTSGGHYIVLTGISGNTISIYDPYLYSGKFDTTTRKGKVTVSGNTVYCSVNNFKNYANYKQFWCYSNDKGADNTKKTVTSVSYTRYVATQSSNLNVRSSAGGSVITSLAKGTAVTVTQVSGDWSKISSPVQGWVSTSYLSASSVTVSTSTKTTAKYTTGTYKTTSNLNVRAGAGTKYKAKTYKQLSANARSQNRKLGGEYNGYRKGVVCTVTKVNGNWGYTKSGWICLDYCKKI